jgi:hypothetical protein
MYKLKAIMIKDWHINKKSLLIPFWITAGFYAFILLSVAFAYFKGDMNFSMIDLDTGSPVAEINYIVNMAILSLPGLMSLLFIIMLTQGALNEDIRKNCELFHRSQPVSIWFRTGSKYLMGITSNWAVMLIIALFNFLVINIILAIFHQFDFYSAINGMILSLISFMKTGLIIGSITFFFSAIFKDKAFFQGFAILLGVQFLFMIVNTMLNWHLPLPLTYLFKLIKLNPMEGLENDVASAGLRNHISTAWNSILFNWKTLIQLAFSGALFAGSTLIYKNKEIK